MLKSGGKADDVLIRDFRKSDLDDLLILLPLSNAEEFRVTGFDPDHVRALVNRLYGWKARILLGLLRLFGKEPLKFLVAVVDDKFVGTTVIETSGKAGSISVVMVHPDFRRRGIATKLMTTAIDFCRRKKKVRAVLGVLSENAIAKDLYEKLGFKMFESSVYLVGESGSLSAVTDVAGVEGRPFEDRDLDDVYELIVASEDPVRLKIHDFDKKSLKVPFLQRFFRSSNQIKLVAVRDDKVVGYVEASYTTPNETARIGFLYVNSESAGLGVEKVLVNAARLEIEKAGVEKFRVVVPSMRQALIDAVKDFGFKEALVVDGMVLELS
jgi:ribosomal protein S18 acetylase RimI-like enzyme